jgi:hypothetical protein
VLVRRVHAHPNEAKTCGVDLFIAKRQADQLAAAIRSPVPPEEEQDNAGIEVLGQCPRSTCLVGHGEIRCVDPVSFPGGSTLLSRGGESVGTVGPKLLRRPHVRVSMPRAARGGTQC